MHVYVVQGLLNSGLPQLCSDGASVFKGKGTGVITQLQENHAPFVEGVHCMVSDQILFLMQFHFHVHFLP
jgi:hypothetical protein